MPHYQHLTVAERYQIFILLKAGFSFSAIARQLNRHRSTIHRELGRNLALDYRVTAYSPSRADQLAWVRRRVKPHFKISLATWDAVMLALQQRALNKSVIDVSWQVWRRLAQNRFTYASGKINARAVACGDAYAIGYAVVNAASATKHAA